MTYQHFMIDNQIISYKRGSLIERVLALVDQLRVQGDTHFDALSTHIDLRAYLNTCIDELYDRSQHMDTRLASMKSYIYSQLSFNTHPFCLLDNSCQIFSHLDIFDLLMIWVYFNDTLIIYHFVMYCAFGCTLNIFIHL